MQIDEVKLVEMYNKGIKQSDIAKHFYVSQAVISIKLSQLGVPKREPLPRVYKTKPKVDKPEVVKPLINKKAATVEYKKGVEAAGYIPPTDPFFAMHTIKVNKKGDEVVR